MSLLSFLIFVTLFIDQMNGVGRILCCSLLYAARDLSFSDK